MGSPRPPEVDRCVDLAFDLHHRAEDDEPSPWLTDYFPYSCGPDAGAELASDAAASYHVLAQDDARFAARAQRHARQALDRRSEGFTRSRVFDQVTLASIGFRGGELEQACRFGQEAIRMAGSVGESRRVRIRLAQLMDDTTQHQREPAVRDLREELRVAVAGDR
jgi:hypothetical protein